MLLRIRKVSYLYVIILARNRSDIRAHLIIRRFFDFQVVCHEYAISFVSHQLHNVMEDEESYVMARSSHRPKHDTTLLACV